MNQDGTGLTRLTHEPVYAFAVRPTSSVQNGLEIAYVTQDIYGCPNVGNTLKLLSWPRGDVRTIVSKTISDTYQPDNPYGEWIMYTDAGLVWSPSGNKLAFASAMDDISFNVFVYDVATEQITRIAANNDTQEYKLLWSADERYVIHQGYRWIFMVGVVPVDLWSARADANGVTPLVDTPGDERLRYVTYIESDIEYLGWFSPTEIIVAVHNGDIRVINVETGDSTILVGVPFQDVAYSPEHNLFLLTQDVAPSPNRLLTFYQNDERREVVGYTIKYVEWLSANSVFLGQTPSGRAYLITPDGIVTEIPSPGWKMDSPHRVIVSPDGQWWAWHYYGLNHLSELWIGPAMEQPSILLSFSKAVPDYRVYDGDVKWSPDSQHLLWFTSGGLYVASPPEFETTRTTEFWRTYPDYKAADFSDAVWVQ